MELGCWAHARRKFYEARSSSLTQMTAALAYIGLLYRVERKGRGLSAEERLALRQRYAKPVLAEFEEYLLRAAPRAAQKHRSASDRLHAEQLDSAQPLCR